MTERVYFSDSPDIFEKADRLFETISQKLKPVLPGAEIHHIGSTAIHGSLTKGDLDIVVRVAPEKLLTSEAVLAEIYARNTGSVRNESFSSFLDSETDPELGIQLVAIGSEMDNFLDWIDLQQKNPSVRKEYKLLKQRFHGKSMDEYRNAKAEFIEKELKEFGY